MKFTEVEKPHLLKKIPDQTVSLLSSGDLKSQGFIIKSMELREYVKTHNEKFGPFSLITSYVETNEGSIEMTYFVGYRGKETLEDTKNFIAKNLGLEAIILRSIISLKIYLEKNDS